MSAATIRGGIPHVWRASIDSTGRKHRFPFYCNWLAIRVSGASEPCRMYFSEADFTADANYILAPLSATDAPYGEWSGPAEVCEVWLKSDTSSNSVIELVAYQRRG